MTRWPPPVAITGAGAVTPLGAEWRGFGRAVLEKTLEYERVAPTGDRGISRLGFPAAPIPAELDVDAPSRRRMSHAARLSAVATKLALRDAGWSTPHDDTGFFLGVGASGASLDELAALMRASTVDGRLDLHAVGGPGLRACNPLFTFQTMNNFTLCHAAILEGIRGPNAAIFSRGGGTVTAMAEAAWSIAEGICPRALTGAADSALHPMTWAEGSREGWLGDVHPAEGAAILALEPLGAPKTIAVLEGAFVESGRVDGPHGALLRAVASLSHIGDSIQGAVVASALSRHRNAIEAAPRELGAKTLRLHRFGGESLAATPAMAALAALDLLVHSTEEIVRIASITIGLDGDVAVTVLRRPA